MSVGRTLWIIVAIKLIIMFAILRIFFFKPELNKFKSDSDKAQHVIENLAIDKPIGSENSTNNNDSIEN